MIDITQDVVIVVPTIRDASIKAFLTAWRFPCQVIVVEDNPEPTFGLMGCTQYAHTDITHYAWSDIEKDLGSDSWIIPRRTDCIRSYGYWKAYQTGKPYIITLDDDCLPVPEQTASGFPYYDTSSFIQSHLNNLQPHTVDRWYNTLDGAYPRGFPYEQRSGELPIAISHGLWRGVRDYDSLTQLREMRSPTDGVTEREGFVPFGPYYPMCGMNLAWRREYTPLLYFLLMGQDKEGNPYPFDRFGDIWAGVISKKILDHLGAGVWSGSPCVQHERASNVWANYRKEHAGIEANESFWQWVDGVRLTETTAIDCYHEIGQALGQQGGYWATLARAMTKWSLLYAF